MKSNDFLSVTQISDQLEISRMTVIRNIHSGKLKAFRKNNSNQFYIKRKDFEEFKKVYNPFFAFIPKKHKKLSTN